MGDTVFVNNICTQQQTREIHEKFLLQNKPAVRYVPDPLPACRWLDVLERAVRGETDDEAHTHPDTSSQRTESLGQATDSDV